MKGAILETGEALERWERTVDAISPLPEISTFSGIPPFVSKLSGPVVLV